MQKLLLIILISISSFAMAQPPADNSKDEFTSIKLLPATSVKNQANTGTCWSFSTTSLLESQCLKNIKQEFDLSEMFSVRNIYVEKARNYILRQGKAQFGQGGLGHDVIRSVSLYGAVPIRFIVV
jgi:bleomycin hydrolase